MSRIGDAWVLHACGDFDRDDRNLVRAQFTHRRVTLDGDVITVWPRPRKDVMTGVGTLPRNHPRPAAAAPGAGGSARPARRGRLCGRRR
ncbi:hypothetical protein ABZZ79_39265 [Streptomyces sp. NPDC006458]|uniref:hypothetical protein n=1 Tax=Streptomyces sp. NPDC006458 TaxID=3154302 RepID=UPI0033AA3E0D